jgi:hypothetical protein
LEADVEHLVVHAIGSATGLPRRLRDIPALPLLLAEVHGLLTATVVLLDETAPLESVDVSAHEDVHGLQSHHHIVPGASGAVAYPSAIWTEPVGFLLAIIVVLEAVAAILPPADLLVIYP